MMKRKVLYIIVVFIIFQPFTSCQREGYYNEGEQNIIDNLTEKSWERKYRSEGSNGDYDVNETYLLKKDGTCVRKYIYVDSYGETEENVSYSRWTFYTPDYGVIYFDSDIYWEVRQLTPDKLSVIETFNYNVPNQTRYYKDFAVEVEEIE